MTSLDPSREVGLEVWKGIGVHPTPLVLVKQFGETLSRLAAEKTFAIEVRSDNLRLADLFAGDGRLGRVAALALGSVYLRKILATFVESNPPNVTETHLSPNENFVVENAFGHVASDPYDIVVSNPPYLALTAESARRFGLDWGKVAAQGRNLYGVALSHALRICRPGGLIAFVCPFGWLNGAFGYQLRKDVLSSCDHGVVLASSSRFLFENVQQDVAFHVFRRASLPSVNGQARILFSMDGTSGQEITLHTERGKHTGGESFRVRVGPFVWNRERASLTKLRGNRTKVVYGGNISAIGELNFNHPKYRNRQHIRTGNSNNRFATVGPAILVRRVLRGRPGAWVIDSALLMKASRAIAENHVLVVELPRHYSNEKAQELRRKLVVEILRGLDAFGSPNLSKDFLARSLVRAIG
jgi:hypothetical protein